MSNHSRSAQRADRRRSALAWLVAALALLLPTAAGSTGPRDGAASRIPSAASASEYWDLTARLDSGHRVFVRFTITNEGRGRGAAEAFGHLILPDGTNVPFDNGRTAGNWDLSSDGLRIHVSSSILDQTPPQPKFEYDSSKRGVKLHPWFDPVSSISRPGHPGTGGYAVDLLDTAAPVHGTLCHAGMSKPIEVAGVLGRTHTSLERSETELSTRRIDFLSLTEGTSVYLTDRTTPGGARTHWLVVQRGPDRVYAGDDLELDLEPSQRDSDYPLPAALRLRGPPFVLKLDPDGDGTGSILQGTGVTNVTFPNPFPRRGEQR